MPSRHRIPPIELPRIWNRSVRSAVLHAISLAHYAITCARGRVVQAADSSCATEIDRLRQEIALLREELRIKDRRMARVPPARRPHYPPVERMAILELRAARGWSLARTAAVFFVTPATIAHWLRRIDEAGPHALVQLSEPVNKFPQFVGYLVRALKRLCPTLGKRKIAEILARAGLHLSASTVSRMLKQPAPPETTPASEPTKQRRVTAKCVNHTWHVDLTVVPTGSGFWTPWLPFALPQCWPFCWWVAVVVDHVSRRALGVAAFPEQPTSEAIRALLGRTIRQAEATPKYLICDKGAQFDCHGFRRWCKRRGIRPRYGAVGKHGSIAIVDRFIRTLKEGLRRLVLVPMRREAFQRELTLFADSYNEFRPHAALRSRTPNEVYFARFPAARRPRYEPRPRWPRGSPCAKPWALMRGRPGAELELQVDYHAGRRHLPIVTLRRAA